MPATDATTSEPGLSPSLCFHRLPLLVLSPHHRRPFAASVLLILAWPQVSFANFAPVPPSPSTTARFSTHLLSNRVAGAPLASSDCLTIPVAVTDHRSVIGCARNIELWIDTDFSSSKWTSKISDWYNNRESRGKYSVMVSIEKVCVCVCNIYFLFVLKSILFIFLISFL